jgi:hypothetical protein
MLQCSYASFAWHKSSGGTVTSANIAAVGIAIAQFAAAHEAVDSNHCLVVSTDRPATRHFHASQVANLPKIGLDRSATPNPVLRVEQTTCPEALRRTYQAGPSPLTSVQVSQQRSCCHPDKTG